MNAPSYASSAAVPGAKESNSGDYQLRDELAQFCLPAASQDATRMLAWANSICFLFLLIGLIGLKPPEVVIRKVEHVDEVVPAVFEPPPVPQTVQTEQPPEENNDTTEAPQVVTVVAADASAATFAVPVQGATMIAPAHLASAPPSRPAAPPKQASAPKIKEFVGGNGRYPDPPFLQNVIPNGAKATVVVEFTVDERGKLSEVKIIDGSGYGAWDRNVLDTVRRRWAFTPGDAGNWRYEFEIQAN